MELDFIDISKSDEDRSVMKTAVGSGNPVRATVRNPDRTIVNIDISRTADRERNRAEGRNRSAGRSRSEAESRKSRLASADESRKSRPASAGESRKSRPVSAGESRKSRPASAGESRKSRPASAGESRKSRPAGAGERRYTQSSSRVVRRSDDPKVLRAREQRRRRRLRQQILAKLTVFSFMGIVAGLLVFGLLRLTKGGLENSNTVKRIEDTFTENAERREVIKTNKTGKPVIEEDFLTINEYSRPGEKLERVNNIFVHYTANKGTSAAQNRSYFENLGTTGETSASAHFIIGFDGEIVQCIPLEEIAYAVQKRNYDSVSIECCFLQDDGKFTDATYQSLIRLSAWLLNEYNLAPEDMRRHYDEGGKKCPLYYVEHEDAWEQFLKDLRDYIMTGEAGNESV